MKPINTLNIVAIVSRRSGETFAQYVDRVHTSAAGRWTEQTVDYIMAELGQPPEQRGEVRRVLSSIYPGPTSDA